MKTQIYDNFRQRIHKSSRDKGFPLRVMFELTYQCNFYCKHCYVPLSYRKKSGELKTKKVFSILDQQIEDRRQKIDLKSAWEKLKNLVKNIKLDENYQCEKCELEPFCKWCPAKAWLYNGSFTSCEPQSRKRAKERWRLFQPLAEMIGVD